MGITLAVFITEGETPEKKERLHISDSWLEMSFLSDFNSLVGTLLGPTDLWESNEDMTSSISVLPVGYIFKIIWKMCMWKWNIMLQFISNWRKIVVENIRHCRWIGNSGTINSKILLGISAEMFLK